MMNRVGFLILSILLQNQAESKASAMTVREIADMEDSIGCKENTLYKAIRRFELMGYVERGLKDGRSVTYYVTDKGRVLLQQEK